MPPKTSSNNTTSTKAASKKPQEEPEVEDQSGDEEQAPVAFDKALAIKEFREKTNRICELVSSLTSLAYRVGRDKTVTTEDGSVKRKREVNGYCTAVKTAVRALNKQFAAALSPKRTRRKGNNVGFTYKTYVTDELRDFFVGGEDEKPDVLGYADPNNKKDGFLAEKLNMLRDHNLTNQHILTVITYIYIFVHELQDPDDGRFIKADDRMHKYFGELFKQLAEAPDRYNDKGKIVARINPDRFMMASMQTIVTHNRVHELTEDQDAFMKQDDVKDAIKVEEELVAATMHWHRENRKALKEAKAEARAEAKAAKK